MLAVAGRVRLWRTLWRFEDGQAHRHERPVDAFGVNTVSIVEHESTRLVPGHDHAKLLRVHSAVTSP